MPKENQHWVPKFLVKNFADADGRVFCLNIKTDEITKLPPKRAASSVGFNEFYIGGEAVSFEDKLEKLETQAAPILKRMVNSRSVVGLTEKQRNRVADFMAAQSFRTDAFYKGMELGLSRGQFGPVFAELWRSVSLMSAEIARRPWTIMVIDDDNVFYLGDHPMVLQLTENPGAAAELGFDIQGIEAFLPLTPKCALYMPSVSIGREIVLGYENALSVLRDSTVASTNPQLRPLAERLIRNTKPLYRALTAGVALVATAENVENLNSLQCYWAHTAVYSNRPDFAFAQRVFRDSPQYRKALKTRSGL